MISSSGSSSAGSVSARAVGDAAEDLAVRQRLAERLGRLHLGRERAVEVGDDDVVALEPARGGQHHVGEVGRVGREQVDDDGEQILALEGAAQARLFRARGDRVDVPADERARSASGSSSVVGELHVRDRRGDLAEYASRAAQVILVDAAVARSR